MNDLAAFQYGFSNISIIKISLAELKNMFYVPVHSLGALIFPIFHNLRGQCPKNPPSWTQVALCNVWDPSLRHYLTYALAWAVILEALLLTPWAIYKWWHDSHTQACSEPCLRFAPKLIHHLLLRLYRLFCKARPPPAPTVLTVPNTPVVSVKNLDAGRLVPSYPEASVDTGPERMNYFANRGVPGLRSHTAQGQRNPGFGLDFADVSVAPSVESSPAQSLKTPVPEDPAVASAKRFQEELDIGVARARAYQGTRRLKVQEPAKRTWRRRQDTKREAGSDETAVNKDKVVEIVGLSIDEIALQEPAIRYYEEARKNGDTRRCRLDSEARVLFEEEEQRAKAASAKPITTQNATSGKRPVMHMSTNEVLATDIPTKLPKWSSRQRSMITSSRLHQAATRERPAAKKAATRNETVATKEVIQQAVNATLDELVTHFGKMAEPSENLTESLQERAPLPGIRVDQYDAMVAAPPYPETKQPVDLEWDFELRTKHRFEQYLCGRARSSLGNNKK